MLRGFLLIFLLGGIALVAMLGFRGEISTGAPLELFPDMVRQMKVRAQAPSGFFADGRGPREPVVGTVPLGYEMPKAEPSVSPAAMANATPVRQRLAFSGGTDYYNTGKMSATNWGTGVPVDITPEVMARGRERFNITCAMCHGQSAAGTGVVKQLGLATVVSLQDKRIRDMADGEIFDTITHGKNTMMAYGPNLPVNDRWAIICYLRALQRSQGTVLADVPEDRRADLDKAAEQKPGEQKPAAQPEAKK